MTQTLNLWFCYPYFCVIFWQKFYPSTFKLNSIILFIYLNIFYVGGIIASNTYKTVKLLRYVSYVDYFVMSCEFIYIMFIIYYIIEEALEIYKVGLEYILQGFPWNHLDLVVVMFSVVNQEGGYYQ